MPYLLPLAANPRRSCLTGSRVAENAAARIFYSRYNVILGVNGT
jgi:hypothetical protein